MIKAAKLGLNKVFPRLRKSTDRKKKFNLADLGLPSRLVDEDLFLWFQRIQNQQTAILALAKNEAMANGDFEDAIKIITETSSKVLQVERASIWLLSSDSKTLRCVDLFERTSHNHSVGLVFEVDAYPHYFRALESGRAVDADDAYNDPRTHKLHGTYLKPNGITSVLNAAIRVSGKTVGVICHEHVGVLRKWRSDEICFAGEITDQMAQVLINCKRRHAEEALKKAHDELERRVRERTKALSEEIVERRRAEAKQKMLQVQLLQSEKLSSIGLLAAGVAHELNSPLTGLLTLLRIYRKRCDHSSQDYEILSEMLESSEHMAKIVKDLNHFSKSSEDEEFKELDIHEVIETTLSFSGHQLFLRNIRIIRKYTEELPKFFGNKSQLQQVILNLLTNSKDAMPQGGDLTISTYYEYDHNTVNIEFSDTGEGIKDCDLPKIFDPFFTTKARGKGTGLGLSVSHGIIQRHNGEFLVESKVGKGTKFIIKLLVAKPTNQMIPEEEYGQRENLSCR